jgi:hypothetical protein
MNDNRKQSGFILGGEIPSTYDQPGCDLQDSGGNNLADGFQELYADQMYVAGVLFSFDPRLNGWHAGGHQG